ncbi:MAG: site-2 protease family protein [archaeon]|nr:site-2 protease family protein [archaeon]
MATDFPVLIIGFLLVSALITFLIKTFTKHDTFFLISLIKSKKPLGFFDKMAKHEKFIDAFTTVGLILGFGAIAVDYLYGRNLPKAKRALLFLASFAGLSLGFLGLDILFDGVFSNNLLVGPYFPALVVSFGLMGLAGFTLFSLFLQALDIVSKYLLGIRSCPGVAPLIPGVEIPGVPISPPLHAWLSLLIILLVHEGMHGIVGRREGFKIKSTGVILFGFLPVGAFVEPDEGEISRAKDEKVLPFLAAGPMANLVVMLITGVVLFGAISVVGPVSDQFFPGVEGQIFSGVAVAGVLEQTTFCGSTYPAPAFGKLEEGDKILAINAVAINNPAGLARALGQNRHDAKTFLLERNSEQVTVTIEPNELGQYGFVPQGVRNEAFELPQSYVLFATIATLIIEFLFWLFLLNFLVAALNFLPMPPFDGGRMAALLFLPYVKFSGKSRKEKQELIAKFFLISILTLLFINALPLFF